MQQFKNTHLDRNKFADELNPMLFHVFPGTVGHVLVKASQQNGPNHDGDIKTQTSQEASTLQGHIRGPDNQGLSRAVWQWEKVVTSKIRKCSFE